jgi:hypothetical protein
MSAIPENIGKSPIGEQVHGEAHFVLLILVISGKGALS